MKRQSIKYKHTTAVPGSELHTLLESAREEKDGQKAQALRQKADILYNEIEAKELKLMGEEAYNRLKEINKN